MVLAVNGPNLLFLDLMKRNMGYVNGTPGSKKMGN